jgi:hypothetical protein
MVEQRHGTVGRFGFAMQGAVVAVCTAFTVDACTTFASEPAVVDAAVVDAAVVDAQDATAEGKPSGCGALLAREPSLRGMNGVYTIAMEGGAVLSVYCDMTLDKGGWTLVGRSGVRLPAGIKFGWSSKTGDVQEPALPYSLNVVASRFTFTEVLVATSNGERAFKFHVNSSFLKETGAVSTGPVMAVAGDCNPEAGPSMLRYAGATHREDVFFLRDGLGIELPYGLTPLKFEFEYQDCPKGGNLDDAQGMIMIR